MVHPDIPSCYVSAPRVPLALFSLFQMLFAVLAPVAVSGSWGDRVSHPSFLAFVVFFPIVAYSFTAHWVKNPYGFLALRGTVDYAGGIVLFTAVGAAGLVGSMMVERRFYGERFGRHNQPLFIMGALLVLLGFFALIVGSAYGATAQAAQALLNAVLATAAGGLTFVGLGYATDRHWHVIEILVGGIAGLAGVSSGAGYMQGYMALAVGVLTSFAAFYSSQLMKKTFAHFDVMDITSVWGVPGALGALLVAITADSRVSGNPAIDGVFRNAQVGWKLMSAQFIAVVLVIVWSAAWTWIILFLAKYTTRLDLSIVEENKGLDLTQIGESAYDSQQAPQPFDMSIEQVTGKLCEYAAAGNTVLLDQLIEQGASPHELDFSGRTAAHYAAENGRLNVLQLLFVKYGVDLNALDDFDATPLQVAVESGHTKTAQWLRFQGAQMANEHVLLGELLWAASNGDSAEVARLLDLGIVCDGVDFDGKSSLIRAASEGHIDVVEMLVKLI